MISNIKKKKKLNDPDKKKKKTLSSSSLPTPAPLKSDVDKFLSINFFNLSRHQEKKKNYVRFKINKHVAGGSNTT